MSGVIVDLLIILFVALIGGIIANYLKQSVITGYLLAGLFLGSAFLNIAKGLSNLDVLAQIGVALLMFSIGTEFSFERIEKVRKTVVYGGILQILVVIVISLVILPIFHFSWMESLIIGIAFSMSSTALIAKLLNQYEKSETLEGEMTIGWTIIQDMAVVPLLILVTDLGGNGNILIALLLSIVKALLILAIVYVLSKQLIPDLLNKLAGFNIHELLFLGVIILIIACSAATSYFGLSYALGAFIAGLIVSKGFMNYQLSIDIRPLREIFTVLFFVSVGALLNPSFILSSIFLIIFLTIFVIVIKFLSTFIIIRAFGNHGKPAFFTSSYMAHVGEFSFVIASMAKINHLISPFAYSIILSISLVTLVISPFSIKMEPLIYLWVQKFTKKNIKFLYRYIYIAGNNDEEEIIKPYLNTLILGYGRVGRNIGAILKSAGVSYGIVDFNQKVVEEAQNNNLHAIYGEPTNPEILKQAGVESAKVIIITIPDSTISSETVKIVQQLNPHAKIVARSHLSRHRAVLEELGVDFIVEPEYEAAVSIVNKLLKYLGKSKRERRIWLALHPNKAHKR